MTGRMVGTVLLLAFSAAAQQQGTAPGPISPGKAAEAAHHACLDQERAALEPWRPTATDFPVPATCSS